MILTETQLLLAVAVLTFVVVSLALFFMERDRPKGIKARITFKNILVAISFGILVAWLAWIVIHCIALVTGHPTPANYPIGF